MEVYRVAEKIYR